MKTIGSVAAILNDVYLLLKFSDPVSEGQDVKIFGKVALPAAAADLPLVEIVYAKGDVRVSTPQAESGFYLAQRYRDEKERTVRKSFGAYSDLLGGQEVVETVHGAWSANLSKEEALNVKLDLTIKVGDLVCR